MRRHGFLTSAAMLAALSFPGAASAQVNLVLNPDFSGPRGAHSDYSGQDIHNLVAHAAADPWLVWAGQPNGRVQTWIEPSDDGRGNMLHVQVENGGGTPGADAGIDEVFLPYNTGPQRAYYCVTVKIVSGSVGFGANNMGQGGFTAGPEGPTGSWVRIGGESSVPPVNQIYIFASTPNAEFYVRNVQVSAQPIVCERQVAHMPFVRPETYVQPLQRPWEMHPEQGSVVRPAGNPVQGAQPNAKGFYNNMTPGGVAHDDSGAGGHEPTHPVPGKAPASGNTIQQQQPAQPANQK